MKVFILVEGVDSDVPEERDRWIVGVYSTRRKAWREQYRRELLMDDEMRERFWFSIIERWIDGKRPEEEANEPR